MRSFAGIERSVAGLGELYAEVLQFLGQYGGIGQAGSDAKVASVQQGLQLRQVALSARTILPCCRISRARQ